MWMILAHHLTHDTGGLAIRLVMGETALVHPIKDPAVHWLQAISRIWQSPADDDGHGIIKIGTTHLLLKHDRV